MTFQIQSHGTRDGVIKYVKEFKLSAPEGSDLSQLEAAKALILSEINALAEEFNGVRVDANGNTHAGARTLQINVIPQKLHVA